jgi:hypothetical protein
MMATFLFSSMAGALQYFRTTSNTAQLADSIKLALNAVAPTTRS